MNVEALRWLNISVDQKLLAFLFISISVPCNLLNISLTGVVSAMIFKRLLSTQKYRLDIYAEDVSYNLEEDEVEHIEDEEDEEEEKGQLHEPVKKDIL